MSIFFPFLKLPFSGLKSSLFYPEDQKTIFSGLICPKDKDDKKFDFLTKTMDQPSWKISNFWTFLSFSFWSKKDFFYPE